MAALQHSIFVSYCLVAVDCGNVKCFTIIGKLSAGNALDSLDAHFTKLLHIQLAFTANTDNVGFFTVYTVFLDQLVKTVGITRLQTDKGFTL